MVFRDAIFRAIISGINLPCLLLSIYPECCSDHVSHTKEDFYVEIGILLTEYQVSENTIWFKLKGCIGTLCDSTAVVCSSAYRRTDM